MNLAVIGGGSTYTPELVYGFLEMKESPVKQILLLDTDPHRLDIVEGFCNALARGKKSPVKVISTGSLDEALTGADFVVTQIRVGGNKTRAADEEFASSLGIIAQETTGAVGFLKAWRTVPVICSMVEKIQSLCPDAFLINFTNPAGLVSSAVYRAKGKKNMAGLCNVPIFMERKIISLLAHKGILSREEDHDRVTLLWGGFNHLSWLFDIKVDGVSHFQEALDLITGDDYNPGEYFPVNRDFARRNNAIPSPYLRYYTDTGSVLEEQHSSPLRGEMVMKIEMELLELYRDLTRAIDRGKASPELPGELSNRGGADYSRLAVSLIRDLALGKKGCHILNVPDRDEVMGPGDMFVELPVYVSGGPGADTAGDFEYVYPHESRLTPEIRSILQRVREYETLTVEAGLSRNVTTARQALSAHPLVGDDRIVDDVIDYMSRESEVVV